VWDVQTGECQHTLEGHSSEVTSVVFSPDGSRVASGSRDNTVRVWDIASVTELLCYDTQRYNNNIQFTDNSTTVVVNGELAVVPLPIQLAGTTAASQEPDLKLTASRLAIRGDWVT
jgi:WD40 repeat protein